MEVGPSLQQATWDHVWGWRATVALLSSVREGLLKGRKTTLVVVAIVMVTILATCGCAETGASLATIIASSNIAILALSLSRVTRGQRFALSGNVMVTTRGNRV